MLMKELTTLLRGNVKEQETTRGLVTRSCSGRVLYCAEVNVMMNTKWASRAHIAAAWLWGAGLIAVGVAWLIHH